MGVSAIALHTQKRVNRFDSQTEYLPKLDYVFYDQVLEGFENFYLQSDTNLGKLVYKTAHSDESYDAIRLYSHNVLTYPTMIRWLSIKPKIGHYGAYYSKDSYSDANLLRSAFETGTTLLEKRENYPSQ